MSSLLEVPLTRRMHRLPVVRLVHGRAAQRAWSWDLRDQFSREWWPQGITWAGERLLVSWYSRRGAGSRVSVVDLVARGTREELAEYVEDAKSFVENGENTSFYEIFHCHIIDTIETITL